MTETNLFCPHIERIQELDSREDICKAADKKINGWISGVIIRWFDYCRPTTLPNITKTKVACLRMEETESLSSGESVLKAANEKLTRRINDGVKKWFGCCRPTISPNITKTRVAYPHMEETKSLKSRDSVLGVTDRKLTRQINGIVIRWFNYYRLTTLPNITKTRVACPHMVEIESLWVQESVTEAANMKDGWRKNILIIRRSNCRCPAFAQYIRNETCLSAYGSNRKLKS